jgi:glutamate racemase
MVPAIGEQPVGVFDSGVGGLSVLRAIRVELPGEHLVYVGDTGSGPYGDRSAEFVTERAKVLTQFLVEQGVKAVVVACNTATSIAVSALRVRFGLPIVAIEPAIKPAASRTRSRVVGVLATTGTLASSNMAKLLANNGADVEFLIQPCPGLADQKGADILVLGCTHYPFVAPLIHEVAGPEVEVIDPATAVARELRRRLETNRLLRAATVDGAERFWTTGAVDEVRPIVGQLWGRPVEVSPLWRT